MNTLARCSEGPEALAGLELQHDLQLSLSDWRDWQGVTARLIDSGAELSGLNIARNAGGFDARCRVRNLTSQAARALTQTLLGEGLARQASVEHLMLARRDVG
ncbi:MAG TPA: hypothetical protein PKY87_18290 [Terricaulis sp.]|nr:hypothetical protein [Terricaulis sp.]